MAQGHAVSERFSGAYGLQASKHAARGKALNSHL